MTVSGLLFLVALVFIILDLVMANAKIRLVSWAVFLIAVGLVIPPVMGWLR